MRGRKKIFKKQVNERLSFIYPSQSVDELADKILSFLKKYSGITKTGKKNKWNQKDAVLITYADSIVGAKETVPLNKLKEFADEWLADKISDIHILPFFPYSSDDGFSVIDYYSVNPTHGDWEDIKNLRERFSLMFDLVINHGSAQSKWFQNFIKSTGEGSNYFLTAKHTDNLKEVVRPRSSPLLTRIDTAEGEKLVWTTFSDDQVDFDFKNPEVLLRFLDILLYYMEKGARIIRLDAIAFLWKEPGTSCLHLPQTHEIVKLMRDVMEYANPSSVLLTETNVPNKQNLSYFGRGDEAHMVYQFSLPPLLLHALYTGNTGYLVKWSSLLPPLPEGCTYFNFTASHDGIGVRPLEGLLPDEEFNELIDGMKSHGGLISMRTLPDGAQVPYEINITYFDALKGTREGQDMMQVDRFLCAQLTMLGMKGIPGIYIHSFFGTKNYLDGVEETGRNRTINRKSWNFDEITTLLKDKNSDTSLVFTRLTDALKVRADEEAFHPSAGQDIITAGKSLFVFSRGSGESRILAIHNFSSQTYQLNTGRLGLSGKVVDILTMNKLKDKNLNLKPYQVSWLKEI